MRDVFITGSGLFTPSLEITNEELVNSFNEYVEAFNQKHKKDIAKGKMEALQPSSAEFIKKASGIESRYVIEKDGILDIDTMHPVIAERKDDEISLQAEMAVKASLDAMESANISSEDIDAVICACSNMQRPYPAMAIEIQNELGIKGFAYDLNVACSSATFAIKAAESLIKSEACNNVLVVNPEICTAHLNFRDRDSHFIFGDVATALILESSSERQAKVGYKIVSSKLETMFSNNIRNNGGFMNRLTEGASDKQDKLFYQEGRKVFKEVTVEVLALLKQQLEEQCLNAKQFKRLWLHQANLNMNRLIASRFMGEDVGEDIAPVILDKYANTASAGSVIVFHQYRDGLNTGDLGLLCSFGAGYSIGSVILEKVG